MKPTNKKFVRILALIVIATGIFVAISLFISNKVFYEINDNQNEYWGNKTSDAVTSQDYQEIETILTDHSINDLNPNAEIDKEIKRLRENGQIFWYSQNRKISKKTPMYYLQNTVECKKGPKEKCLITGLQVYEYSIPPEYKVDKCDAGNGLCPVIEPAFQKDLANSMKSLVEFYGFGKDIYMAGSINGDDNYSVFKNEEKLFSHKMNFGAESVFEETSIVLDSPAFTFYEQKEGKDENNNPISVRNIWYKGETLNEKYEVESSSYLFSYKDRVGFVGEKKGKKFFFFNGQKISQDFDAITTHACCAIFPYPIEIDENGILFFMAKRGEKYFLVEANLNEYLDLPIKNTSPLIIDAEEKRVDAIVDEAIGMQLEHPYKLYENLIKRDGDNSEMGSNETHWKNLGIEIPELSSADEKKLYLMIIESIKAQSEYYSTKEESAEKVKDLYLPEMFTQYKKDIKDESVQFGSNFYDKIEKVRFSKPRAYKDLSDRIGIITHIEFIDHYTNNYTSLFIFKNVNGVWKIEKQSKIIVRLDFEESWLIKEIKDGK